MFNWCHNMRLLPCLLAPSTATYPTQKIWVPELREGATFEQNFFSDFDSARYSSIQTSVLQTIFQKSRLVNRSSGHSEYHGILHCEGDTMN